MACGAFVALAFLFPMIMKLEFVYSNFGSAALDIPVTISNSPNELLSDMSNSVHYKVAPVSQKAIISNRIAFWSPTASLLAIPTPAAFVAGIGKISIFTSEWN
jgi:hypothetical protein